MSEYLGLWLVGLLALAILANSLAIGWH